MECNIDKKIFTVHNKVPTFEMPEIMISRKIKKFKVLLLTDSHMRYGIISWADVQMQKFLHVKSAKNS